MARLTRRLRLRWNLAFDHELCAGRTEGEREITLDGASAEQWHIRRQVEVELTRNNTAPGIFIGWQRSNRRVENRGGLAPGLWGFANIGGEGTEVEVHT